jgi:hypothetical protein
MNEKALRLTPPEHPYEYGSQSMIYCGEAVMLSVCTILYQASMLLVTENAHPPLQDYP